MYLVMKNGLPEREAVGNIEWSENHFQTAESLSDSERSQFDLYLIVDNQPDLTAHQKWGESTYTISGTDVIRTWVAVDKTVEEIAVGMAALAAIAREKRDSLLAATDWVVLRAKELGQTVPLDVFEYRGDLRQLPEQAGFPSEITWPTKP
tara:strand:+ start:266 stop:715 length:450 start_codon:yes stop_codon:yes gene_type:complete